MDLLSGSLQFFKEETPRKSFPLLLLLLSAGFFLYNPFLWRFNGLGEYTFISRGIFALWILALLLFFPEKTANTFRKSGRYFPVFWGGLFLFTLLQALLLPGATPETWGEMEFFLLLPLLGMVFAEEIRKFAGKFLALLGIYQLLFCACHTPCIEKYIPFFHWYADWSLLLSGITGNANWTSSLLILALPFSFLYFHRLCRRVSLPLFIEGGISAVLILTAIFTLWNLASIGSLLSVAASLGVMLFIFMRDHRKYLFFGGLLALLLFTALLFFSGKSAALQKTGNAQIRLELLLTSAKTLLEAPLAGFGNEGTLEGALSRNRGEGYFLAENSAVRTNHPHNEIIMRLLLSGIPAGVLYWIFFMIYPLWKKGTALGEEKLLPWKRGKEETEKILFFWALLFLVFHGQLDLALFAWPLREISLLLLGFLWSDVFYRKEENVGSFLPLSLRYAALLFTLLLLGYGGFSAYRNFRSMTALRDLDFNNALSPSAKIEAGKKAALLTPHQGLLLYRFTAYCIKEKRWEDALFFADRFPLTFQKDYGRNHGFRGQILFRLGRTGEAFAAFRKDAELFPLAVVPLFNMLQIARYTGKKELLPLLQQELERRKKIMGYTQDEFRAVLQNRHNELRRGSCPLFK